MADYISRLRETSLGEDLYAYLKQYKAFPTIESTGLNSGTHGTYSPATNTIKLNATAGNGTLTHEVAHAADAALDKQYYQRPGFVGEPFTKTYFTDGYDKLKGRGRDTTNNYTDPREDFAKKLSPSWFKEESNYRATSPELVGWGAGRQAGVRDGGYNPPPHLDATMATELSILMDLARRKDVPFPKEPSLFERLFK